MGLNQLQTTSNQLSNQAYLWLLITPAENRRWLTLKYLNKLDNAKFSEATEKPDNQKGDRTFKLPGFEKVHRGRAKPPVTLKLLGEEYLEECQSSG